MGLLSAASAASVGCRHRPPEAAVPGPEDTQPVPDPLPRSQVFVLESGGGPPEDTVVTVPTEGRIIVIRRGPPDNTVFAQIAVPTGTVPIALTIRPSPGLYGVTIDATPTLPPGAVLSFSYAVHFVAPAGARERYGSDIGFERELTIAGVGPDTLVTFLPTKRPGSDYLSAVIPGPGRYAVAAPR